MRHTLMRSAAAGALFALALGTAAQAAPVKHHRHYAASTSAQTQINAELVKLAKPGALVMHCLPAYRGKEIDEATFEANADTIFDQAENRLHVQKAVMKWLVS